MRDIVTKVNTLPKSGTTIKTKTKYKSFEDYARLHRDVEESESCSATSYMLKSKFKSLGADLDLDKYKGRCECIKDDQESVGSDDSGVGSISETKDHTKYAAYNEFLSGYRKKPETAQQKKVVRSEIFIQVKDDRTQLNLNKPQNFNSVPRKFEPTAYPKPEVAASIVKPVIPPNLARSLSLRCGAEDSGGCEIAVKPKLPPAPLQLKTTLPKPPVKKSVSNQYIALVNTCTPPPPPPPAAYSASFADKQESVDAKNDATVFCIPAPPPFLPPPIKTKPAPVRAAINANPVPEAAAASNPMQMVFDEIRKRNTNLQQVQVQKTPPQKVSVSVLSVDTEDLCKESSKTIPPPIPPAAPNAPPPPPPPMFCEANGTLRKAPAAPAKTTQVPEKERQCQQNSASKPAPPPLQQELFKKLSEMNKKNQHNLDGDDAVECAPPAAQPAVQKYSTLSRFMETEKECLQQQQQKPQYQSGTLERQDPKKRIVYNVYRDMLGSYNAKANGIVAALPARMVREDQGVKKQLESL